ncbi:MAG: IS1 family transposase [Candidatus Aenigmatarchaeota archaeon]
MEEIKCCPKCSSQNYVKNGKVKGRQRYLCKNCGYKFTVAKLGKRIEKRIVVMALQLYLEGLGFRAIERVLGVSHVSVMNWVEEYGKDLDFVKTEGENKEAKIIEIDEICSYLQRKKRCMDMGWC